MWTRRGILGVCASVAAFVLATRRREFVVAADPSKSLPTPLPGGAKSGDERPRDEKLKLRQREGAKLADRRGRFERRGDRYLFLTDNDSVPLIVLENLMLERVSNVLADAAGGSLQWSISGTVTEFRGSNFLLLERAVVKSLQADDEPQRTADPFADSKLRPVTAR